jgi:O-antigen ligase
VTGGDEDNVFSRLQGANGNGRYEYWQAAQDANATAPWKGIGPGSFEFWWSREGTTPGFVRDAHTLYLETLAETGVVGFVLLIGLFALLLVVTIVRSLRAPPGTRIWIAAAVGALATFMEAAAFEWVWEVGAIACAVMALAAVILVGRDQPAPEDDRAKPGRPLRPRIVLGLLAAIALGAVSVPMAGALATRDSRSAADDGRLTAALEDSRTAERLQPYAATPRLQRALLLERTGQLAAAAAAARAAAKHEPTNWRMWFTLARIEARRGEATAAVQALRKARTLNPRSPLLAVPK